MSELIITLVLFCVFTNTAKAMVEGETKLYGQYNGEQTFTAPEKGYYQLEVWGAQGGGNGGYGAYTTGVVLLEKDETLYISVGSIGAKYNGGYNGGGNGGLGSKGQWGFGGGGATHIAKSSGLLSNLSTKTPSILIVASGGGGGCSNQNCPSGHGGGIKGMPGWDTVNNSNYRYTGTGATLTAPGYCYIAGSSCGRGAFGKGGSVCLNEGYGGAGGGGGFFGGGGSNRGHGAGGGGSSYMSEELLSYGNITKVTYCYDCGTGLSSAAGTRTISVKTSNSQPVSNTPKLGSGSAKITLLSIYRDPKIKELKLSGGTLNKKFSPDTYEYGLSLDSETSSLTIDAIPMDPTNKITGLGTYDIPSGTTDITLTSTSTSGNISTYIIHISRPKSNYPYLKDIKISGQSLPSFQATNLKYETTVPYDQETLDLEIIKGRTEQEVHTSDLTLHSGKNTVTITVISEDKNQTVEYTLTIHREHSTKLKLLDVKDYTITPTFDQETLTYNLEILPHTMSLNINALPFDEEAKIKIEGLGYIKSSATGKIIVTEPNCAPTIYTINVTKIDVPPKTDFDFPYTGQIETFTPTISAYYLLETWGSQGGGNGGYGAYSKGVVYLEKGETVYIAVGGTGTKYNGGFNGGGNSGYGTGQDAYGGGGATHIATTSGLLKELSSNRTSILIVAAGGGGGCQSANCTYGHGGGYVGAKGYDIHNRSSSAFNGTGATLTAPGYAANRSNCGVGAFGQGANFCNLGYGGAGGGAGYFGGGGSNRGHGSGGGGSSYVGSNDLISYDKVTKGTYCYGCSASNAENTKTTQTKNVSASPTSNYAKKGTGYAKISMLRIPSENNMLEELTITIDGESKTYTPELNYNDLEYRLDLTDENATSAIIDAIPFDNTATVKGTGTVEIKANENEYPITVTAENGAVRNYKIIITRPASTNSKAKNITISGLTPSLCEVNDIFCKLDPEIFDPNTDTYQIRVPGKITQIWFNVEKGHPYQTVAGSGRVELKEGENNFTITITSEDQNEITEYHYKVIRDMSDNPNLQELEVIDPAIDIGFQPEKTDYSFSVPNEYTEIGLKITPSGEFSKYVVIGNEDLKIGTNQIIIAVTAVSGDMKFYFLNVYREKDGNVYLSDLKITNKGVDYPLVPEFDKLSTGVYHTTVPNNITEIDIVATAEKNTTTVEGTGTKTLHTGINQFRITTNAENGDTETYIVEVIREKNNNPNLKSITLTNGNKNYDVTPGFDGIIEEYTLEVGGDITYMNITAIPEESTTTYKLLENNSLKIGENIKQILAIAEDGTTKTYRIKITRNMSSNNYLENIKTSTGSLNPNFDKEESAYEIIVPNEVTSINIEGIKSDPKATVTGNGIYSLIVGQNEIELNVTAEDGSSRRYVLTVTREKNKNADLKNIDVSEGTLTPNFQKETLNYTINVPNETTKINITGIPEARTTKVIGNGEYNLTTGENRFTLTTLASDNATSKTYVIVVNRAKSDNNNLKHLLIEEATLNPEFHKDTLNYTAYVPNEITTGVFHIETEEEHAKYQIIGNTEFQMGDNEVKIEVTSESGKKKTYNVIVHRQEDFSGSDYLTDLSVQGGTLSPAFSKEQQYYEVKVPNTQDEITVTATPEDEHATVTGAETYKLNPGRNLIKVTVTSTDGNIRDYQILVIKDASSEARLENITLDEILSPSFHKDTYEYTTQTASSSLNITKIIPVDENATYQILGNNFDDIGWYDVIIRVTASDQNTRKEYIIHVEKTASNNNNLENLEVLNHTITPTFNKTTTLYQVTVGSNVNNIVIEATKEDEKANVTGDGLQNLSPGENIFIVKVTSESGRVKAYTIIVNKERETENKLRDLIVHNGVMTPSFDPDTSNYEVIVENTENNLDLTVILENDKSSYKVVGNNLKLGMNEVKILVTSESGVVNIYTLSVIKKEVVNALLENIKVENYRLSPRFNRYINHYDLLINNETEYLNLTVTPEDKEATWKIIGSDDIYKGTQTITTKQKLNLGESTIEIEVTSSDTTKKETYTIHIHRQEKDNDFLNYLYTSEGDLTPKFNSISMEYTIDVSEHVEVIELFGGSSDTSATINGLGTHTLIPGANELEVSITTKKGIKRVYYITVNRKKSTENYLETLIAKNGFTIYDLDPQFTKENLNYEVNVPAGTLNITFEGTFHESATVTGLTTYDLESGTNTFYINVTSEEGTVRTYTITVNREHDTNNHLINIIPSLGTFTEEFEYEKMDYELHVDESAALLSFEVVTESNYATVTGTEAKIIEDGISTRTITVTSESGEERSYTITIYKERKDNARLKELKINGYELEEDFDPNRLEYHVTLPNTKQVLFQNDVIAAAEDPNATVKKSENLKLSTVSPNEFIITVTAPDGFTKQNYKIIITREKGSNALLNNLEVTQGKLETIFTPETLEYNWIISKSLTLQKTDILPTPEDKNATINIIEEENRYKIIVTSEDQSTTKEYILNLTYTSLSDNTELDHLIPSVGTLDYTNDRTEYEMTVENDVTEISFDAEPTDPNATVEMPEKIELNDEKNEIIITVIAEDEVTKRTIKIVIKKGKSLESIEPNVEKLILDIDETEKITYTLLPEDTTESEVRFESENDQIAEVDEDGNVTAKSYGTTTIKIISTKNDSISTTVEILVMRKKIASDQLDVVRMTEEDLQEMRDAKDYIIGLDSAKNKEDFLNTLLNDREYIQIYDLEDNEVEDTHGIGTGYRVKLIYEDVTYDELLIIVRGDLNGDGLITAPDFAIFKTFMNGLSEFTFKETKASDINNDKLITAPDFVLFKTYMNGLKNSLNEM